MKPETRRVLSKTAAAMLAACGVKWRKPPGLRQCRQASGLALLWEAWSYAQLQPGGLRHVRKPGGLRHYR